MTHFSLYYIGPNNTLGIIPDWTFQVNPTSVRHLEGYLETEMPILQKDFQIPATQMERVEKEYKGKFVRFDKTRPKQIDED